MASGGGKVGILWRGDRAASTSTHTFNVRLQPLFEALAAEHVAAEPVVFAEDAVETVREQLLALTGVLVWVDPIMSAVDRTRLDHLLRDVASSGVWVSAHPDVILKMGTKDVLYDTRHVGWGGDTHVYATRDQFRAEFPPRLASSGPRVLKQHRGNGGIGVWKVTLAPGTRDVLVQDAHPRDTTVEEITLADFMVRCDQYFADGRLIDQPFQSRIAEGMIRCYLVQDRVAGFSTQSPDPAAVAAGAMTIFGLPAKKTMYAASEARFAPLKQSMEAEWLPAMQRALGVEDELLPMLWDADFLYGPRTAAGGDTYVLCEVNVSSVFPYPEQVNAVLARAVAERLV